ncbi:MAG: HlyD family efflux transporter periplasmic adaptor subunit [Desulfamplus sp.]|nr:HlyD family efflux transporter periplasmic adaptor subunit [Desulfamplus sp.]
MEYKDHKQTHFFIKAIRLILPILIIGAGIAFAKHLYDTKPVAKRIKPVIPPPLVETIILQPIDHSVIINSMGKVISSQTISLKARVGGFVIETSPEFIPGGIYKKGDVIVKLDPKDFELVLKQQEAMLAKAEASLKLEMGKQDVARAELRLMQNTSGKMIGNSDLALRVPQLEQIKADIASIKVDIEKARLNLERTTVKVPFNCTIIDVLIQEGSQISSQEPLATIAAIDEYRVETAVPVDQLKWIDFSADNSLRGSDVIITTADGIKYQGFVIRLIGKLSDKSRLAKLLITIEDPLYLKQSESLNQKEKKTISQNNQSKMINQNNTISNKKIPLLIDSYVQADIQGKTIENVFKLPRAAVRDGDKIWLADNGVDNKNDILVIKNIDVLWKDREAVYIKDSVKSGDRVVISELSSPVNGMIVKIYDPAVGQNIDKKDNKFKQNKKNNGSVE